MVFGLVLLSTDLTYLGLLQSALVGNSQFLTLSGIYILYTALTPLTGLVFKLSLTHGFFYWRIWAVRKSMIVPVLVIMWESFVYLMCSS